MIIADFNGIALGAIITQKLDIKEELIRHIILNSLRMYNKKFREEYGQMVIACDHSSWRKDMFPQYKASRKKSRESDQDTTDYWNEVFRILNVVRDEIKENLPYKVIHEKGAEADDIIGALVHQTQEFGKHEPVMILSADKDFIQLHRFNNVRQYSPAQKKFVKDPNPRLYMFEHIMKGDSGDGVPNVLSPDNSFTDSIRQSPITKKKLELWLENAENLKEVMDEETYRNYCRNQKLINLDNTPKELIENIINSFDNNRVAPKMKVLNYLIKKRCSQLIECVEEFYPR
jgi:5'-3' exonuclease